MPGEKSPLLQEREKSAKKLEKLQAQKQKSRKLWRHKTTSEHSQESQVTIATMFLMGTVVCDVLVMSTQLYFNTFSLTWLFQTSLVQWSYMQLPYIFTILKLLVLLPASFNRFLFYPALLIIFAFIIVLAVDAINLDSFTQAQLDLEGLDQATLFNTVPLIFSAIEWFTLIQVKNQLDANHRALNASQDNDVEQSKDERSTGISFGKMLKVLKPYFWPRGAGNKFRACSTYLLLATSKVAILVSPLYMANATNALMVNDPKSALRNVFIFSVLTLISKVLKELQSVVYLKVKQTAYIEIATLTYEHLHSLSLDWHLKKKLGDVLRSMDRGVESANSVVSYMFLYLVPTIAESVVVIIIFATHFKLATLSFVAFISLVLYGYATIKITLWRKKFREETNKHDNEYHDKATDALINYETIKYFTNEPYEISAYTSAISKYQKYSVSVQASLSVLNIAQATIIQITVLAALGLAIGHVVNQDGRGVDLGAFVAISVYLNNLFQPLYFLGSLYNMMIKAYVDMAKLSELLSIDPDIVDHPDATKLLIDYDAHKNGIPIEFRNVCFDYPDQVMNSGLKQVSFVIPAGTTTALVGETGAGKTTISRLLYRFYDTDSGHIMINNQNIQLITQNSLRKNIGIVPQDTVLFNDTILHNIQYGNMESSFEQCVEAARNAKILDFIEKLPLKWYSVVGERGLKLSGGEKQRIAIARTLLKDPPFVILDEATSALDSVTENEIQMALNQLKSNRTMLVIAHRLSTIRYANQIVVLGNGSILEMGDHEFLLSRNGKYASMWNTQLENAEQSY